MLLQLLLCRSWRAWQPSEGVIQRQGLPTGDDPSNKRSVRSIDAVFGHVEVIVDDVGTCSQSRHGQCAERENGLLVWWQLTTNSRDEQGFGDEAHGDHDHEPIPWTNQPDSCPSGRVGDRALLSHARRQFKPVERSLPAPLAGEKHN